MQKRSSNPAARIGAIAAIGALALTGCSSETIANGFMPSTPEVTDKTGALIALWTGSWAALLAVGVLVWGLMIWALIVYRKRKGDNQLPVQLQYHVPLELMYTVIPIVMVGVLFVASQRTVEETLHLDENPDLTVQVYGKQWSWDFYYSEFDVHYSGERIQIQGEGDDMEHLPTLYLPLDQNVQFEVMSRDVNHAFWIPEFLYKSDMIPGRTNTFQITPTQEGVYRGKCAEMCGEFHSEMLFRVEVIPVDEFEEVMAQYEADGQTGPLDDPTLNRWGNTGGDH
ncbi:MAG: cytochrome c oxidase subunit II [Ruaniaceae bacterium]|nr:cytochrome c oxidase subunit II [Ruaniaceae bacterium]